ncbi:uncharacterized protein LOC118984777 [Sturnira hondurensis]|uniref:uncharacterized protein LOC118984777 n=1 Tax=Sturnira hondurensis TaxID=192404 RepID=UPI0018790D24|nr:uncharacterized protein LOC118984777 [Sturnira hondurensis]
MNILDGKLDLFCKLQYTQNVKNIRETCSKYPHSKVVYLCEDRREMPEEAMREYAGLPVIGEFEMCNGTRNLTFSNNSWQSNCISKNGSSSSIEPEEKVSEPSAVTVIVILALLSVLLPNIYVNWCKNRSSKSQPSPSHLSSQAIQPPYVPARDTDPEDDDLHSVATDGSADTATATADTHDAVPGETSVNPTEDPYPSGTTTMDTFLTADSESVNAYDSAYCESYDSASLDAETCGSAVAAFPGAEDKNDLLSKYDSQKQVEMLVFAVNQQVYNPEYH